MFDLDIDQGSDLSIILKVKDIAGNPVNLTGATFTGQARLKFKDTLPVFTFSFNIANQNTNMGEVELVLTRAQTSALVLTETTKYFYDVLMLDTSNKVYTILKGRANVLPEVTR